MKRKSRIALLAAMLTLSIGYQFDAHACFRKKDKSSQLKSEAPREPRKLAATSIKLVDDNPSALVWTAQGKPKAVLLALHELGLYSGVFDDLGQRMSQQGVSVYAIDLRGFGQWQGMKGKSAKMDLDKTYSDTVKSIEAIRKLNPGTPVFVLGEAMGGALALHVAAEHPDLIQGTISAAPGGEHFNKGHDYVRVASLMVAGANKDSGMGDDLMNRATPKAELKASFQKDSMVRLDLKPRELMACQFYMYKTKRMAKQIKDTPVLVVHGEQDRESRPEGSSKVYEHLATKDKDYLLAKNGDHYTFEDTKVDDDVMNRTISWIDNHLKQQ